jgi:hypothetical protein
VVLIQTVTPVLNQTAIAPELRSYATCSLVMRFWCQLGDQADVEGVFICRDLERCALFFAK